MTQTLRKQRYLVALAFQPWMDTALVDELLAVFQVNKVMPNTFTAKGGSRQSSAGEQLTRSHVIAVLEKEAEAVALHDRLLGTGVEAGRKVGSGDVPTRRQVRRPEKAKASTKIYRALPQLFEAKI